MKFDKFEDIICWQLSQELTLSIYDIFRLNKDYSFKDQIQRASVSVMNNIAEGFERRGDKEFQHFLFIAKGSCGEVRSMLYLALNLNYISKIKFEELSQKATTISCMLSGLIKKLL
jgi:four helix bundle protein